jgi:tetratricopeptide (TPR) repeat protein
LSNTAKPLILFIIGLGLIALVSLIYWPGLHGGFFFDDYANIVNSDSLKINNISIDSIRDILGSGIAGPLGRPISLLTFATNYYFTDLNPFYFKLTNLVIHLINAGLVYLLVRLLLRTVQAQETRPKIEPIAIFVAALWAILPIQLTSVLYVVQRMTSLSSLFILVALILHVWARQQRKWGRIELAALLVSWGLFFPLAIFSKETGILLLLYVAAYEGILQKHVAHGLDKFGRGYILAIALTCSAALFYILCGPSNFLGGYSNRVFSLEQRLLTEARVVLEYIRLIYLPSLSGFSIYHDDFQVSSGLLRPLSTLPALAGLIILPVLAWRIRTSQPLISFGIFWFLLGHTLESSIIPLELMHEHRNYLPSLGLILIPVAALNITNQRYKPIQPFAIATLIAFGAYYGLLTYLRSDMYGDDFRRTQLEAEYHPNSERSQYSAGALMVDMYNKNRNPILYALAYKHFENAIANDKNSKLGLLGMLQLDCLSSQKTNISTFNELSHRTRNNIWTSFDRIVLHALVEMSSSKTICLNRAQVDALFAAALENPHTTINDRSVVSSDYAYYLWIGQKDYQAAHKVLVRAIADNRNDTLNRLNLIRLDLLLQDKQGAINILNELKSRKLKRQEQMAINEIQRDISSR